MVLHLAGWFASDAGKKGGEFFTPTCASKLLARLATVGLDEVKNAADSCAGSGSLLLEVQNHLSTKKVGHFYATEKNGSNYNLLRKNLLMHGVPYKKFSCFNSDSIKTDNYYENGEPLMFDIQVENPPYSAKFDQNPKLLDAEFFKVLFMTYEALKQFTIYSQGMSSDQWNLKFDIFSDLEFDIPCSEEQAKIVTFFKLLDKQIEIEKDKLDALKMVKKGLLQQMFV